MIYIVTPVFNRIDFTNNYLLALSIQTNKSFKIIIVDDGSNDGTVELIEQKFPDVILLKEKGDLWWAEATNVGVRYAIEQGANYIMTLNDDTLPEPDYIEKMLYWSDKYPKALLGAMAIDVTTNRAIYGGEILNWKTGKFKNILANLSKNEFSGLHKVNIFPGRGLLIPKTIFTDIGFYDSKNFPQTFADIDFTCRAYARGYEIFCNHDSKIKIYPDESGGVQLLQNRSLKNYYNHLFGMRGSANLKWFIIFSIKNTPKKYLLQYLIMGVMKRIVKYPFEWIKEILK